MCVARTWLSKQPRLIMVTHCQWQRALVVATRLPRPRGLAPIRSAASAPMDWGGLRQAASESDTVPWVTSDSLCPVHCRRGASAVPRAVGRPLSLARCQCPVSPARQPAMLTIAGSDRPDDTGLRPGRRDSGGEPASKTQCSHLSNVSEISYDLAVDCLFFQPRFFIFRT